MTPIEVAQYCQATRDGRVVGTLQGVTLSPLQIVDGLYFLHPEGECWIGAFFRDGRLVDRIEKSNAATHAAARDRYAGLVPSDIDVDVDVAEMVVAAVMGSDCDADMVIVQHRCDG